MLPHTDFPRPKVDFVVKNDGTWCFRLVEDYELRFGQYIFRDRAGWKSDLASIPRIFWPAICPLDLGEMGVYIHDSLGLRSGNIDGFHIERVGGNSQAIDKLEGDRLWLQAMIIEGVPRWRRRAAYRMVRLARPEYGKKRFSL